MILSRRVALNGVQLDEIHERIVIRSIDQGVANESLNATERMGGYGQRLTRQHYNTLDVTVTYAIDVQKTEMALRRQIMDLVNTWALGKGWLTVNWMEERQFYVDKVIIPNGGDPWNWTDEFTITFRAYNVPSWQDVNESSVKSGTSSSSRVWLTANGNMKTPLNVSFRNMSGMTINTFSVSTGGKTISLSSLGLGGSDTLIISHGTDGLLRMTIGNTSVYAKYTGADDLMLNPGSNAVDFTAARAGVLTASCVGRWI